MTDIPKDSIVVATVEAVANTIVDPSAMNIVNDLELAHALYNEFKSRISVLHPSVSNIFKVLF